jgi:nucleotide-binding universal stress UspA family protein
MGRIVVGIDGSVQAVEALRWAIGEARLRGATIDAIDAWNYPYVVVPGAPIPLHPRADQADDVEIELEQAVAAVAEDADGVTINPIVTEGVPAAVLCEAAEGADLLVIGHGHHSRCANGCWARCRRSCATPCPVVVVPHHGIRRRPPLRFAGYLPLRSAMRRASLRCSVPEPDAPGFARAGAGGSYSLRR